MSASQINPGHQYIHYNPDRVDYSVTGEELAQLQSGGSSLWKDVCLVSAPLGISCLVNAIAATEKPFELSLSLFLNYLLGILGLVFAIIFGIAWRKAYERCADTIEEIKKKPKMVISHPETVDVGSLPAVSLVQLDADKTAG